MDTVRGLAALSVVWAHYVGGYGLPTQSTTLYTVLTNSHLHALWDGFAAVSLFFVLSGFVLTLKYVGPRDSQHPPKSLSLSGFVVTRICRIWLPYVFCLALSAVAYVTVFYDPDTIPPRSEWLSGYWRNSPPWKAIAREVV